MSYEVLKKKQPWYFSTCFDPFPPSHYPAAYFWFLPVMWPLLVERSDLQRHLDAKHRAQPVPPSSQTVAVGLLPASSCLSRTSTVLLQCGGPSTAPGLYLYRTILL